MAVQPESLEVLDKAQFPAVQARAIVRAIEIEIGGARDALATKQGILLLRQDTDVLSTEVRNEFAAMRDALMEEIHKAESRRSRQLLGSTLTLMSMMVVIFTFLLVHGGH